MLSFWKKKPRAPGTHSRSVASDFCIELIEKSRETFGEKRVLDILRSSFEFRQAPKYITEGNISVLDSADVEVLKVIVIAIINETVKEFGTSFTESMLASVLSSLEKRYSLESIGSLVMPIIPAGFLENRKVKFLSKEELERQVSEKIVELHKMKDILEYKVAERTRELEKLLYEQYESAKLLIRRDLELTRANEQLQELDDRKSDFLSIAAHQLRTPLSGTKWTLSMIMNGELGAVSDDQKTFLKKSYDSNERMINLVDDMLHADRIDSGKYHITLVKIQLLDLIDSVLYDISPLANKRNVHIELDRGHDALPLVDIDQEKIRAVFQNLLDNAVKYSRENSVVTISSTVDKDAITFRIKDQGIGIPEDQKELVFSRFFRARNALEKETDGSGLGLFIVKSIIERHGGRVWYESKENEGSTFSFTIKI
ncbi:MAG: HAMP domain-containing histidine kinase [Candidatus Taylorbacteria bacterium]|nr:HAMP domain-containing histidine kinase [Candidatus Taylorbacteria bacterium]